METLGILLSGIYHLGTLIFSVMMFGVAKASLSHSDNTSTQIEKFFCYIIILGFYGCILPLTTLVIAGHMLYEYFIGAGDINYWLNSVPLVMTLLHLIGSALLISFCLKLKQRFSS